MGNPAGNRTTGAAESASGQARDDDPGRSVIYLQWIETGRRGHHQRHQGLVAISLDSDRRKPLLSAGPATSAGINEIHFPTGA